MALWKETGSNPSPSASGTPAAGGPSTVTELHGKTPERAPEPAPAVDTTRRAAPRASGTESVIAAELAIEGKIVGGGDVRIAGRFKGDVNVRGDLMIERGAKVAGSVRADKVAIAGELEGNIEAASQVDLLQTGSLTGDLKAATLTVAAGSRMRGMADFGWDDAKPADVRKNGNGADHGNHS